ncbi:MULTISPECIES: hypothetical protein [Rhizobium]|uniref:hypothetical protein n=1 Tax=Rhizobium TaxID=379 RepID=UPI0018E9E27B|nr:MULTISPECIES: hypothetical protein [Rhizobium]NTF42765.1 hypothetical protein [Rhizobium rhizogenes]
MSAQTTADEKNNRGFGKKELNTTVRLPVGSDDHEWRQFAASLGQFARSGNRQRRILT